MDNNDFALDLPKRYRIIRELGKGGMGKVYLAFDSERNHDVAIKVLNENLAEDTHFLKKLKIEAKNLGQLNHNNIVRLYDFEKTSTSAFLVMAYVEGIRLSALMRRKEIFRPGEVLGYLRPIAIALNYAHAELRDSNGTITKKQIVHCDIKPPNIMVTRNGEVIIMDFGISRTKESSTTITVDELLTPAYAAPEQWGTNHNYSPATNIYALGIVIYQMLTGDLPFAGETTQTTGSQREKYRWEHLNAPPSPPSKLNPRLTSAIDQVVLRCLAKKPEDRYQSALDLLGAFANACTQSGIQEVPVLRPAMPREPPREIRGTETSDTGSLPPPSLGMPAWVKVLLGGGGFVILLLGIAVVALIAVVLVNNNSRTGSSDNAQSPPTNPTSTNPPQPTESDVATPVAAVVTVVITATPEPTTPPTDTPIAIPTDTPVRSLVGQIAFVSDMNGSDAIYTMGDDGSNIEQITNPPTGYQDWWPTWCQGNTHLLFERGDHLNKSGESEQIYDVSAASPFGENKWQSVPPQSRNGHPVCSRDGRYVSFASLQAGDNYFSMWYYDNRSGGPYLFGDGYQRAGTMDFFGNGSNDVVFSYYSGNKFTMYTASLDSPYNVTNITPDALGGAIHQVISPDGNLLAFNCRQNSQYGLCVKDIYGSDYKTFNYDLGIDGKSRDDVRGYNPSWSPDGEWIAYASNGDGDWDVYVIRRDGSQIINAPDSLSSNEFMPAWKP